MEKHNNAIHNDSIEHELKRELGKFEAISLVIGMVIGSGIFFKPSIVFKNSGSSTMGILAWLVGGIITLASGLTVAEIAAAIPKTGGLFAYLRELYSERSAFLFGWVQTLIYVPASSAALAIVFVTQATYFVPMSNFTQKLFAMIIVLLILAINVISTKLGGGIQLVSTIGKLLPIIVIVAYGFIKGTAGGFSSGPVTTTSAGLGAGFGAAVLGTLWAYDGWISVGNMAGELKDPKRDLPISIIGGLCIVMAVYVLVNLAILKILPINDIVTSKKAASDAAVVLFGTGGASFITAGILVSIFGALNGYFMAGARIPYAMAQDKLFPFSNFLGKVSKQSKTPVNALIFEFVLACLYILSGSFDMLTDLVVFVLWIFFVMAVFGIFILRTKRKNLERPYKVPLYPLTPLIGIIGGVYILVSTFFTNYANALYGIGVTIIGLPVYLIIKKNK